MQPEWIMGLIGGLLIGLAGAVFLLGNGRIMGASGIVGVLVDGSGRADRSDMWQRIVFLAGVFVTPVLLMPFVGTPDTNATSNIAVLIAAGLLVGVGTRLANGCTSGHGVCGISRFSFRGIIATVFYILAGGLTMVAFRHLLGVI